jgi:hypothetical protein
MNFKQRQKDSCTFGDSLNFDVIFFLGKMEVVVILDLDD